MGERAGAGRRAAFGHAAERRCAIQRRYRRVCRLVAICAVISAQIGDTFGAVRRRSPRRTSWYRTAAI